MTASVSMPWPLEKTVRENRHSGFNQHKLKNWTVSKWWDVFADLLGKVGKHTLHNLKTQPLPTTTLLLLLLFTVA